MNDGGCRHASRMLTSGIAVMTALYLSAIAQIVLAQDCDSKGIDDTRAVS